MEIDKEKGFIITDGEPAPEESSDNGNEQIPEIEERIKRADVEKATRFSSAPRINKRAIIMTMMGILALVVVLGSILRIEKPAKKEKDTARAPEVIVPDFGDYQSRSYRPEEVSTGQEINSIPMETYIPAPPASNISAPVQSKPVSVRRGYTETELAAMGSPLIPKVEGVLLGRNAPGMSTYQAMPASVPVMSSDDYLAQRYSELANALPVAGGIGGTAIANAASAYTDQNMQSNKNSFYSQGKTDQPTGRMLPENTIWKGTIIPGVLITGINTDLPGDVQARVTENVYDSLTGNNLLIPQGTVMIASYNSSVSFAQERVQIAWNTLIRPDGYEISLGNMNGVDAKGFSGTKGQVDNHFFQYVKAAGIVSAFTILNGEISYSTAATTNPTVQNLIAENQAVVNKVSAKIIDRALDIQPTLRVKSGARINIMVNNNIRMPAVENHPAVKKYQRN